MEEKKKGSCLNVASMVIIVLAAVIMGFTIGMYVTINMVENAETETEQTQQNTQSNTTVSSTTENTTKEEEYVELEEDDEIVTEITSKYDFTEDGLIALLYKEGDFNLDTVPVISNDEILAITWGLMVEPMVSDYFSVAGLEISSGDYIAYDGNGTVTVDIPESVMEEYVQEIFGSSIEYTNSSFDMTTESLTPFRVGGIHTDDAVTYSDGTYTATYIEGGGSMQPTIEEYVQKILKYSDRIEVYVNTGYWTYDDEENATLYSEYDFEHEEFYNEIWSGDEDDVTAKAISELHTHVYTYTLDENTGEYYLSSFDTVVDE